MFMFAVLRTMCVWVSIMIAVEEEEGEASQVVPCGPLLQLADSATHQQWLWLLDPLINGRVSYNESTAIDGVALGGGWASQSGTRDL